MYNEMLLKFTFHLNISAKKNRRKDKRKLNDSRKLLRKS